MHIVIRVLAVLLVVVMPAYAQNAKTPYAGQEKSEIKALSGDEVQSYLSGHGMGLAKAAELNQYPGPKHVLELASHLGLSEEQKTKTQKIYDKMHRGATRFGELIINKEKELNQLFVNKGIDSTTLRRVVAEIARFQGELRVVHLQAHLEMRRVLSPSQVEKYDQLRGYKSGGETHTHKHN